METEKELMLSLSALNMATNMVVVYLVLGTLLVLWNEYNKKKGRSNIKKFEKAISYLLILPISAIPFVLYAIYIALK